MEYDAVHAYRESRVAAAYTYFGIEPSNRTR